VLELPGVEVVELLLEVLPLVAALPQPGRNAVDGVDDVVPVPLVLDDEPCICGGSGLGLPGVGAAELPVIWFGVEVLGLMDDVLPEGAGAPPAAVPPLVPVDPPDDPPPLPCASAAPLMSATRRRDVTVRLAISCSCSWCLLWPTSPDQRGSSRKPDASARQRLTNGCYKATRTWETSMVPVLRVRYGGIAIRAACLVVIALMLTACDKCGNSIFRMDAGPFACKEPLPKN